jgi:hypothetical protein
MAEPNRDDTSSRFEWVSPREYIKRIAEDPAAETEAEYFVTERFRCGKIPYCYRAGDGELHYNDLLDDFRCEVVIDFATAIATRPARIVRKPNPGLPYVRDDISPPAQWVDDDDPFSRCDYIYQKFPAETITELRFLAPGAPAPAPAVEPPPRKKRRVVQGNQGGRIEIKLKVLFPDGIPSAEELSDSELVKMVEKEFEKDPKKIGLGTPHAKTILRNAGRIPRKK